MICALLGRTAQLTAHVTRLRRRALEKLDYVAYATCLDDLRCPPGNRLEALKGNRAGQHYIRINDPYRICFRWTDAGLVDYH
jgi:proteic killer suppression protein